jgi:DNA-binding CsgD family transcriptional regulator
VEYISQRDIQALSAVIDELDAATGIATFSRRLLRLLQPLVPYDIATYNEIDPHAGQITVVAEPAESLPEGGEQRFMAHAAEHPILEHTREHREQRALKLSDFLSQRQLHQRGIYREFFGPLGIEHQMVVTLPAAPPLVIGVALNRGRGDFSERERRLLNLLRPHLERAHGNALAWTRLGQTLRALERALEAEGCGVVLIERRSEQPALSAQVVRWLEEYCDHRARRSAPLPDVVTAWLRRQRDPDAETLLAGGRRPLVVQRGARRLRLQFLPGSEVDGLDLILLRETRDGAAAPAAPLTPREREVLRHLSEGSSDRQIADALGISRRTVHKHVEHLLAKLCVSGRTAAAAWALRNGGAL